MRYSRQYIFLYRYTSQKTQKVDGHLPNENSTQGVSVRIHGSSLQKRVEGGYNFGGSAENRWARSVEISWAKKPTLPDLLDDLHGAYGQETRHRIQIILTCLRRSRTLYPLPQLLEQYTLKNSTAETHTKHLTSCSEQVCDCKGLLAKYRISRMIIKGTHSQ